MDAVWLAAAAAVAWGASDYVGGASRGRTPVFMVVAVSQLLGLCPLILVLVARGVPLPTSPRMLLAVVTGAAGTVELGLIYLALSRGEGFVTASVGALGAAAAAAAGLIVGDPLDALVAAGLACALVGGGASAWIPDGGNRESRPLRSAALCVGAAAGLATELISFRAAGRLDPYWATAVACASTALCAVIVELAVGRRAWRERLPRVTQFPGLALVGFPVLAGDMAYALASRHGALSVVSSVSSLSPVITIGLCIAIQRQRPNWIQVAGISLALVGAAILGTVTP